MEKNICWDTWIKHFIPVETLCKEHLGAAWPGTSGYGSDGRVERPQNHRHGGQQGHYPCGSPMVVWESNFQMWPSRGTTFLRTTSSRALGKDHRSPSFCLSASWKLAAWWFHRCSWPWGGAVSTRILLFIFIVQHCRVLSCPLSSSAFLPGWKVLIYLTSPI